MNLAIHGFPILEQLNDARYKLFETSHGEKDAPIRFASWLGQKAMTVITMPANVVGVGVGIVGMVGTACTVGLLKVAIYAVTFEKPQFSSGFMWFGENTMNAAAHIAINMGELVYDAGNVVYLGYRAIRWVGEKLHLGPIFQEIFRKLSQLFEYIGSRLVMPVLRFIATRLEKGIEKTVETEGNFNFTGETPSLLRPLNDKAKENRIDWNSPDRSLDKIFKHYLFSAANIPVNIVVAAVSSGAGIILSGAFAAKVILYATTNINIPVPTNAGLTIDAAFATSGNAFDDTGTNIVDGFVLLYKTSCALGINRVVARAIQVLTAIPELVFS